MTTRLSTAGCNAMLNAITALIDAGAAAGYVEIRTGTQPASITTPATGTVLGVLTLGDPAFAAAANRQAAANAITDDSAADNSGDAGWYRAYDSNGTAVIDGSVSITGGGGDMQMDDISIVAGGVITISSWTLVMPNGE